MKAFNKMKFLSVLVTILLLVTMLMQTTSIAAEQMVSLGSTSTFAVLAGSTITNTGTTTINGNVGLYPGTVFTGLSSATVNGTIHLSDATAILAKNDLITAYNDAEGRQPTTRIPTELGGKVLVPGVYDSADGTFQINGILTLDAQGDNNAVFVFKTASTLVTATGSSVILAGGAQFNRIFWKIGSSATVGVNSQFIGSIFAME